MDIQAAIFDLDGTLIDYEVGVARELMSLTTGKYGKQVDLELMSQVLGKKPEDCIQILNEKLGLKLTLDEYMQDYYQNVGGMYSKITKMPGVMTVLEGFRQRNIPCCIATSSVREQYNKKMKYHQDITSYMTGENTTGDETQNGKPAPDIFLKAAQKLGVDPKKCIVFEDSLHGVQGAKSAGMFSVAVPDQRFPDMRDRMERKQPDLILKQIDDFDFSIIDEKSNSQIIV